MPERFAGKLPPFVTPHELNSAREDGSATFQRKMDALAKHASVATLGRGEASKPEANAAGAVVGEHLLAAASLQLHRPAGGQRVPQHPLDR